MAGVVIADAGPLIALAIVDRLGLLQQLFATVVVAESVRRECLAKPGADSRLIEQAFSTAWLLDKPEPADAGTAPSSLGAGEWGSIQLAEHHPGDSLLILDDRLARRYAIARGLGVIGTVRVLVAAQEQALIEDAGLVIDEMRGRGYRITPGLLQQVRDSGSPRR